MYPVTEKKGGNQVKPHAVTEETGINAVLLSPEQLYRKLASGFDRLILPAGNDRKDTPLPVIR